MVGSNTQGFRSRLVRWLERWGFYIDPFALYEAERERQVLPKYFVDRPYLTDVIGEADHPQTAFLMAGRGDGKTATREMVAEACKSGHLRWKVLPVPYYDFDLLLERVQGDVAQLTVRHHLQGIIRAIIKVLVDEVPAVYFDRLDELNRALLAGYGEAFGDPISRLKLTRIMPVQPWELEWSSLSALELISTLSQIVVQLGDAQGKTYQSIYILVDCVDESSAGPQAAMDLLLPLVSAHNVLEAPHIAFKFFLPAQVGTALRQVVELRDDRLCVRNIAWDRKALRDMVQQRLAYYSNDAVQCLEDLCTSVAKARVMDRLLEASKESPRTLLRLCQQLIHHHVRRTNETLIDSVDVSETIVDFLQQQEIEQLAPVVETPTGTPLAVSEDEAPPETGVYLSGSGHVWVDGQQLTPPLTQQEFRLFETLYRRAPHIVPQGELIESVWPYAMRTSDETYGEQNLRKLVSRLRKRLAAGKPGGEARFVQNVRGRGYWLKKM